VLGVLRGRELFVCNIGDSRVILGCRGALASSPPHALTATQISVDHKPDLPLELQRIEAAGGRVMHPPDSFAGEDPGPLRVYLPSADIPGLAMARSLGDVVVKAAGVTSEPQTHRHTLPPTSAFLVWASDGLFEFLSNEEVLEILAAATIAPPKPGTAGAGAGAASAPAGSSGGGGGGFSTASTAGGEGAAPLKAAAERLIAESSTRWLANESVIDDITVLLVELSPPPSTSAPSASGSTSGAAPAASAGGAPMSSGGGRGRPNF